MNAFLNEGLRIAHSAIPLPLAPSGTLQPLRSSSRRNKRKQQLQAGRRLEVRDAVHIPVHHRSRRRRHARLHTCPGLRSVRRRQPLGGSAAVELLQLVHLLPVHRVRRRPDPRRVARGHQRMGHWVWLERPLDPRCVASFCRWPPFVPQPCASRQRPNQSPAGWLDTWIGHAISRLIQDRVVTGLQIYVRHSDSSSILSTSSQVFVVAFKNRKLQIPEKKMEETQQNSYGADSQQVPCHTPTTNNSLK